MEILVTFVAGFIAALLGSMSGGGAGFFGLYALLLLGLPLNTAIATNKFGDVGFFPASIRNFARKGLIEKKIFFPLLILQGLGVTAGTFLLIQLSEGAIKIIVTLVIVPLFFMLAFRNRQNNTGTESFLWKPVYFLSSLYSGIVGAGSGFIRMFSLISLRKIPALQAAANSFSATFPFAVLSVGILLYAGLVDIRLGTSLFVGNLLGAHIGSKVAIKKGNEFVRYMLLALMLVTLVMIWV
jgi:hypothetical protein